MRLKFAANAASLAAILAGIGFIATANAAEDPMAVYYGNTLNVANSAGVATRFYYDANHTYVMVRPGAADSDAHRPNTPDAVVPGTWEQRGDQICQAPSVEGGVFICWPAKARKLGEEWHTGPDKLWIAAGRDPIPAKPVKP